MINARGVGRESKAERSRRFLEIVRRLEKAMPEAKIALEYRDELQLLVSVMLSAQCTDAVVNQVTPALFARHPTAAHYARSTPEILGEQIKRVGLWRGKAKNLHQTMTRIARDHSGKIPRKREEELSSLLPERLWGRAHQLLIWHGRRTCEARRPHCSRCVLLDLCPRRGIRESD